MREASNIINDAIQNEIGNMKSSNMDLTTFNLRTCVANINPILWDFVCLCTRSVREPNGKENDHDTHVKTIRRFFRVCMMLLTTNASYNTTYTAPLNCRSHESEWGFQSAKLARGVHFSRHI